MILVIAPLSLQSRQAFSKTGGAVLDPCSRPREVDDPSQDGGGFNHSWSPARKFAHMVSPAYQGNLNVANRSKAAAGGYGQGYAPENTADCIAVGALYGALLHQTANEEKVLDTAAYPKVHCCLCLHTELMEAQQDIGKQIKKVWSLQMRTPKGVSTPKLGWASGIQLALFADKVPEGMAESMASIGLVGLYVTVVFQISKSLKFKVYKAVHDIAYEDAKAMKLIYELCMDIYLCRKLAAAAGPPLDASYFLQEEDFWGELEGYFRDTARMLREAKQLTRDVRDEAEPGRRCASSPPALPPARRPFAALHA